MMKVLSLHLLGAVALFSINLLKLSRASPLDFESIATIKRTASSIDESYDYVIIGGGQSGLTVADRLSEDGTKTVLVVEYGYLDNNDPRVLHPPTIPFVIPPEYIFNISTVPQRGLNNRTTSLIQGAVVGGGSAVNAMMSDRGSTEDYDTWAQLGNEGWDWKGLLPYFRKSVNFTPPTEQLQRDFGVTFDQSAYGDGPVHVSYPPFEWPGQKNQWNAWLELGITKTKEINGGNATGLAWFPSFQDPDTQTRSFARTAHYDPAKQRSNYHLLVGHKVLNISISDDLQANGVTFQPRNVTDAEKLHVKAKREVVLAAGAIHSPQILQRSGIGPKSLLQRAGYQTKVDLPGVGQNLQDHAFLIVPFQYKTDAVPNPTMMIPNTTFYNSTQAEYAHNRTGPQTFGLGNSGVFLPLQTITENWQDIVAEINNQSAVDYLPGQNDAAVAKGYAVQLEHIARQYGSLGSAVMEMPFSGAARSIQVVLKPLSRGSINMNPDDPYGEVVADFGTFANPIDLKVMTAIFRISRKWMEAPTHQQLSPVEDPKTANLTTDQEIENAARATINPSFYHPSCTNSMMPKELGGVVGPDLLVHGTSGLSVVDASIMPLIPGTHLCATVYAVAEKAADLIKQRGTGYVN